MYLKRNNYLEVLSLYTTGHAQSFYLREISKLLKLPVKTIQNTVKILEDERIIKSQVKGKNKYFTLNLANVKTKLYLQQAEIYKTIVFLEKYPVFNSFAKELSSFPGTPILVFGSFSDFTATKESDLDLLVVLDSPVELPYHLLPYKLHEIKMSKKNFLKSQGETLANEIIKTHVILNGHDYFVSVWWEKHGR